MFETLFNKTKSQEISPEINLKVDLHSHILPNLDDGSESMEDSLLIVRELAKLGYKKLIVTPHVMSGYYNNSTEKILSATAQLSQQLQREKIEVEIEASAEYYLEESLFELIEQNDILTFGQEKNYILFETSFVGKLSYLLQSVLKIKEAGLTPVLAHPERYNYLDILALERLANHGLLFQLNLNSLAGYYGRAIQEMAEQMVSRKLVSFVGSDCHSQEQVETLKLAFQLPYFQVVIKQNLLNNSLALQKKKSLAETLLNFF